MPVAQTRGWTGAAASHKTGQAWARLTWGTAVLEAAWQAAHPTHLWSMWAAADKACRSCCRWTSPYRGAYPLQSCMQKELSDRDLASPGCLGMATVVAYSRHNHFSTLPHYPSWQSCKGQGESPLELILSKPLNNCKPYMEPSDRTLPRPLGARQHAQAVCHTSTTDCTKQCH